MPTYDKCVSIYILLYLAFINEMGRGGELKCYIHTDRHTYRQTYIQTDPPTKRVLEEHSLLKIEGK